MRVLTGHNFLQGGHILAGHGLSASADAIAALYSGAFADVGFYLPLNDRTYMWQEHTGQTPVTADNDTVGLVLDKSQGVRVTEDGGGNRTLSGLGDELVTNGGFDTDSDWTKTVTTISGGVATMSGASTYKNFFQTSAQDLTGKLLKVSYEVKSVATSGTLRFRNSSTNGINRTITSAGVYEEFLVGNGTSIVLETTGANTFEGTVDNVSVKEVPGNHAYQNTAASRPIWNATEEGVDFDGTDDALKVDGLSGLTADMSWMFIVDPQEDDSFQLVGDGASPAYYLNRAQAVDSDASNAAADSQYENGVKIYNFFGSDLADLSAENTGYQLSEARGQNVLANWSSGIVIGSRVTGGFFLNGVMKLAALTSNTGTTALDAARAQVASAEGITLRNTETLTDQVATGGVYGPSNDTANMFQDSAGTTPVTADQDPVGLVSNPVSGGADLTQTTAAARPLYDEASGLYDFDGTDDYLIADLTGIGDRTNMYFALVVQSTDNQFALLSYNDGTGSNYLVAVFNPSATTTLLTAGGTIYVDGTAVAAGTTRQQLQALICDGDRHLVEVVGANLSASGWDTTWLCRIGTSGWFLDGLAGEFVLIPDPGVVGRQIVRRDILARHPSITFAGA